MPVRLMECGPKCRSRKHAYDLNAAISKGNLFEVQTYTNLCYNGAQLSDILGRSALHVAASCGKTDMVEWIMEQMHGDVTRKDLESGWTAIHRALFYGQLATARLLVQYKSDLYTRDHEGLGPLDIAMRDRALVKEVPAAVYVTTDNHEVYSWGDNSNFTLGHRIEQGRNTPEVVDEFRKKHIAIKQIVMCTYHTVFLTSEGAVYTCGHGLGGRLGHPTEETCLVPKQVDGMMTEECIEVAAARDHTLILSNSGTVYSCGMNTCHQLGQLPTSDLCLVPKPINCKMVKGRKIIGVCAGRFHSVLYTVGAVYTCGLNAGQLGHPKPKGDRKISQLRQVSWLNAKELMIISVRCSDAATVVLTNTGEIYVLHEYQCRKMASNRPDIQRLCVVGGNLDHTDSQILRENGGQPLVISYLNKSGKVFIWNEKSPSLKRANWMIRRQLYVKDFVLSTNGLAIVTDLGEVFVCTSSNKPTPVRESNYIAKESVDGEFGRMSLMELLLQEEVEDVQVRKVVNIHRAMYITADRKGNNYATLQSLPNSCLTDVPVISVPEMTECFSKLLDEIDEYDLIHDLILQVHEQRWPVHKYILVNRCANFPSLLVNKSPALNEMDVPIIELNDLHPQILEQLLLYVYTDTCDLLTCGAKFVLSEDPAQDTREEIFHIDLSELHEDSSVTTGNKKLSAFQVVQQGKQKQETDRTRQNIERNPLKLLQEVGKKWGVKGLAKRLGCVTYIKGQICLAMKTMPKTLLRFDRNKLRSTKWELYDVSLQSEDGVVFQCHKCVLVARLEYFHSMLATGWMETSSSTALSLPVPGDILEILLDYLYTDESHVVNTTQKVELLCNILVVADQMLVARLRGMCEAAIAGLVTLKNVGELLEFASMYNADQLKSTCQQYIVLNLPALLEGRYLDVLSDHVIHELSKYYKNSIPNMSSRIITPYDEGPEKAYLEFLVSQTIEDSENIPAGAPFEPRKSKSKRKRNRTKSSTEEQERGQDRGQRRVSERLLSASSDVGIRCDDECDGSGRVHELSIDCAVESESPTSPTTPATNESQIRPSLNSPVSPQQNAGHWSQQGSLQTVNISSNETCTSSPSLRDIMQEELTRTGKSNHSGQKSGKVSWKEIKKQQQVQQKIASQRNNNNSDPRGVGSSTAVPAGDMQQTAKSSSSNEKNSTDCPWASLNKVVSSFRNLMVEDQQATSVRSQLVKGAPRTQLKVQQQVTAVQSQLVKGAPRTQLKVQQQVAAVQSQLSTGSQATIPKINVRRTEQGRKYDRQNNVVSWGLPHNNKSSKDAIAAASNTTPAENAPAKNAWGVDPASPRSPESRLVASAMASTPPDAVFRFSDIVKDEQQKRDVLTRTTNKPLALIQIEEQAIQDLLKLYKAGDNVDEHITVERVIQESAAPVWKRERVQSS